MAAPDRPPAAPGRRALVLIPPRKRDRLAKGFDRDELERRLIRAGFRPDIPDLDGPDAFPEAIRTAGASAEPPALVMVGGGDGTLSAVADAMAETGLTLAILPLGTANDLARTLAIPADPAQAVDVALKGRVRQIDIGTVDGRGFFNVASIGLSVDVAEALDGEEKRRFGPLAYLFALFRVVTRHRRFHTVLTIDNRRVEMRAIMVAVANGRYHGGGLTVAPDAAIDDGRLDVYVIEPVSHWRMALLLPALRLGTADAWMGVHRMSGREVRVETPSKPKRINVDGEILTRTPASFGLKRRAIRVMTPDRPAAELPGTRNRPDSRPPSSPPRAPHPAPPEDQEEQMHPEEEGLATEAEIALQDLARAAREGVALTERLALHAGPHLGEEVVAALGRIGGAWGRIAITADEALDAMDLPTRDADDDRALIEDVVNWLEGLVGMPLDQRVSQRLHQAATRIEIAIEEVRQVGQAGVAEVVTAAYDEAWSLIVASLPDPDGGGASD
ncbi:lipid kinase [Tistrella mobilis]|uniref:lipid kinase n=1 Tax=Tistrella mobilis TaxID=171437 RepID=UPI0035579D3E